MRTTPLLKGSWIALVLAGVLVACDKSPIQPSPPPNTPPQPPSTAVLTRLDVTGPNSIPPGESGQFTAMARYSDGSSRDVSSQSNWRTSRSSVLTISPSGLATAHDRGEASVTGSFSGRGSTKGDVIVVPAGTYRISGTVRDAGTSVQDAEVAVTAGPAAGLTATANVVGAYRLYGVAGDTEIRVTKAGYEESRKQLQVAAHQAINFDLVLIRPREMVAGTYTLRVTAAEECGSKLPSEALVRTYTAVVTQNGPQLTAVLEGATFYRTPSQTFNRFQGVVEPNRVTFQLYEGSSYYGFYYYYPDVLEQLTSTMLLTVAGSASTSLAPVGLSGTLNGVFGTVDAGRLTPLSSCRSASHRFELLR